MKVIGILLSVIVLNNVRSQHIEVDVDPKNANRKESHRKGRQDSITLGPCKVVLNRECPHPDIRYFLYTRPHPNIPEEVRIGADSFVSNISDTSFNPYLPTKIIIHGYNSDMFLNGLVEIKKQYLIAQRLNVFAIDWSPIAQGPCYPAAVWNARFAGKCSALLVERLRELHVTDIHIIGFSLGAHVTGFVANNIAPYKVPRITGLDPAMPGFTTVKTEDKLDPSDAQFVDVIHTNAFLQGQVEECGHIDFYLNGGVLQPGCWADDRFFACNHHRAPFYFAESINSEKGFWGWSCPNYFQYLLGRCPPHDPHILMGEYVNRALRGMHLVITDSISPFAVGKFTGPTIEILRRKYEHNRLADFERYKQKIEDCTDQCAGRKDFGDKFLQDVFDDTLF